jgi:hypothetical protein
MACKVSTAAATNEAGGGHQDPTAQKPAASRETNKLKNIMKLKIVQRSGLALAVALSLLLPAAVHAGGTGHAFAKLVPMDNEQIGQLKSGDTVAKVCRGCGAVQLIQVGEKGADVDLSDKKCAFCGSENTYLAGSKQPIPFKDRMKP